MKNIFLTAANMFTNNISQILLNFFSGF